MDTGNYDLFKQRVKEKKEKKYIKELEDDYTFQFFDDLVEHCVLNFEELKEVIK